MKKDKFNNSYTTTLSNSYNEAINIIKLTLHKLR